MLYTSREKMALNYILILESLNVEEKKNILESMRFSNIGKVLYMFLLKQTNKYMQCFPYFINVHTLFKKKKIMEFPQPYVEKLFQITCHKYKL